MDYIDQKLLCDSTLNELELGFQACIQRIDAGEKEFTIKVSNLYSDIYIDEYALNSLNLLKTKHKIRFLNIGGKIYIERHKMYIVYLNGTILMKSTKGNRFMFWLFGATF